MPGITAPCNARHTSSASRLPALALPAVATASSAMAASSTGLRPWRSASPPANGATSATASVVTVTVRLTAPMLASNTRRSSGSSAWVTYISKKAQAPVAITATRARSNPFTARGTSGEAFLELFDFLDVTAHGFLARHALERGPGVVLETRHRIERAGTLARGVAVGGLAIKRVHFQLEGIVGLERTLGRRAAHPRHGRCETLMQLGVRSRSFRRRRGGRRRAGVCRLRRRFAERLEELRDLRPQPLGASAQFENVAGL